VISHYHENGRVSLMLPPVIPPLWRQTQDNYEFKAKLELHSEFQDILAYINIPCFKNKTFM
jgi:hypothetical protein